MKSLLFNTFSTIVYMCTNLRYYGTISLKLVQKSFNENNYDNINIYLSNSTELNSELCFQSNYAYFQFVATWCR